MSFLDKLQRKFGRYAIRGLMKYIVIINFVVFLLSYIIPNINIQYKLALIPGLVMKGEVWRLITFLFIPPSQSIIWILFVLYFYYMIGNGLEQVWGSFKFNVYYFIGVIGAIAASFITGYTSTPEYLNLSLFLAFAYIYPDYEVLVFFVLPVKMRYLAILDAIFLAFTFITGDIMVKLLVIASVINFFLFFGREMFSHLRMKRKLNKRRSSFKREMPKRPMAKRTMAKKGSRFNGEIPRIGTRHRCCVCGITENDDPDMDFRYCTSCEGDYEYCMNHLNNHEHKK